MSAIHIVTQMTDTSGIGDNDFFKKYLTYAIGMIIMVSVLFGICSCVDYIHHQYMDYQKEHILRY